MTDIKILVVEDDEILADLIQWRLKEIGYSDYLIAMTGEEGVLKAESYKPDLILMDITLPGEIDGIEAVEKIRVNMPDIPVIYLSSHMEDDIIERAVKTRPSGYIAKPFEDFELNMAIKIALL
ncbi:response regulator [Methanomicrobium antiquum]|uniref:Response regulator n=1 Tax=Methanomicrobium antiquum TaxID=487686 RepID=A0AAF0FUK8_9EURY|nr:response regulator [Methanomicrobium antiquum]MDD3976879.1 response regulator [Methanomicrobium sp.]WFN36185.1 response regulator [Methanomicrobium antiquum]